VRSERPSRREARAETGGERAGLMAVGGVALVAGWVWSTGQVAARLASGRWMRLPPVDALAVAARLAREPGEPARAWPSGVRGLLPAATWIYGVGVVLAVAVAVVALAAWRWRPGRRGPGRADRARRRISRTGSAAWARRRDLAPVSLRRPVPGRLVLGRVGRHLIATEARHSVLVFGPTQSGKTTGLAVPAILEWDGPVIATSVKADLAGATIGWRSRQGRCWVFDPTGTSDLGSPGGWSPIAEAGDWSGAQRVAGWMVDATPARTGLSDGAFWYAAAAKQLAPLLLAARCGGLDMGAVVRWTNTDEWDEPTGLLDMAGQSEAAAALLAAAGRDDRIRSSIGTTLETVLAPFEDPAVIRGTGGPPIDPQLLLTGRHTLYLCGPTYEQARLQGLLASLVSALVAAAVDRASTAGRPLDPPLLLVLDEAANIAPIRDLDALASTGAGLGIQLVTVCQDLAQFTTRYGADRARTIANNHRAKLALSGVSDLTTLDLLSGLAGEQAVREESETSDLRDGRRTRSTSVAFRRLAPADELRRVPPGTGVLIYGHLPPARLRLRPWFADRTLRRRAATARRVLPAATGAGGSGDDPTSTLPATAPRSRRDRAAPPPAGRR
jgi:type IV secretion system protein VirD4